MGQQESPDEGNNIMHSETTGAIKNLAVPLKVQAVNSTGVKFGERIKAAAARSDHTQYFLS